MALLERLNTHARGLAKRFDLYLHRVTAAAKAFQSIITGLKKIFKK